MGRHGEPSPRQLTDGYPPGKPVPQITRVMLALGYLLCGHVAVLGRVEVACGSGDPCSLPPAPFTKDLFGNGCRQGEDPDAAMGVCLGHGPMGMFFRDALDEEVACNATRAWHSRWLLPLPTSCPEIDGAVVLIVARGHVSHLTGHLPACSCK